MRTYNASELEEIVERHRDMDRGMYAIGLGLAALSGFAVASLVFLAVWWWR